MEEADIFIPIGKEKSYEKPKNNRNLGLILFILFILKFF